MKITDLRIGDKDVQPWTCVEDYTGGVWEEDRGQSQWGDYFEHGV